MTITAGFAGSMRRNSLQTVECSEFYAAFPMANHHQPMKAAWFAPAGGDQQQRRPNG